MARAQRRQLPNSRTSAAAAAAALLLAGLVLSPPRAAAAFSWPANSSACSLPAQLRALAPVPLGVVWVERDGADPAEDFASLRAQGFTALKQLLPRAPRVGALSPAAAAARLAQLFNLALDAGVIPWWYGEGGWGCITQELLKSLGLAADLAPAEVRAAPAMRAYQVGVLRARVARMADAPPPAALGEPGRGAVVVSGPFVARFASWLSAQFDGNVSALQAAWSYPWRGLASAEFADFTGAAVLASSDTLQTPCPWTYCASGLSWDFRRYRDAMAFQADALYEDMGAAVDAARAWDPDEPQRTGGAHVLDNYAQNGWDMRKQAQLAARAGSLYISLHTPWHYNLMNGEIVEPAFQQAKLAADAGEAAGGVWTGEWESTGGPSVFSGGQGASLDAGGLRRLVAAYLAAGMRGVGLWAWSARDSGQEMGEYALLDRQGRCGPRCAAAGALAAAAEAWRDELWAAETAPVAALLTSWDNEALYARLAAAGPPLPCSISDCHDFTAAMPWAPVKARVGAARALAAARLPFVHLDERDLRAGALANASFARGLRLLVVPGMLGLSADLLPAIRAWQLAGGRVIADMPLALYDTSPGDSWGAAPSAAAAQLLGDIFGAEVAETQPVTTSARAAMLCVPPGGAAPPPPGSPWGPEGCGSAPLRVAAGVVAELTALRPGAAVRSWLAQPSLAPAAPGGAPRYAASAAPALVTQAALGAGGSSALLAFEAFRGAWASDAFATAHDAGATGQEAASLALLAGALTDWGALGAGWSVSQDPPRVAAQGGYVAQGPLAVHRRPGAVDANGSAVDHWWLINSEAYPVAANVSVDAAAVGAYAAVADAVTRAPAGSLLPGGKGFAVVVPALDALWLRATRA